MYRYSLSKKGREYSKQLIKYYRNEFTKIKKIVSKIKKLKGNRIENLSYSAKVHYLKGNISKPTNLRIQRKAESYGWKITETQIDDSIQWLKQV